MILVAAAMIAPGLFQKLYPHPTGNDGHEEYIQAVDLVEDLKGGYRELSPATASFEEVRARADRHAEAAQLVRAGNRKPFHPLWRDTVSLNLDDLSGLRKVEAVVESMGAVAWHDGRREEAVDWWLDQLKLGDRISRDTLIHLIVGVAVQQHAIEAIGSRLHDCPSESLGELERQARQILAGPPAVRDAVEGEMKFAIASRWDVGDADEESAPLRKAMETLSPADRTRTEELIRSQVRTTFAELDKVFEGPETKWARITALKPKAVKAPYNSLDKLARAFVSRGFPAWESFGLSPVLSRTRLRLLILYVQAERYRRSHHQYPTKLKAFASKSDAWDPISRSEFSYVASDRAVQIYSAGTKGTGTITLIKRKKS